ncbi:carbamoyltransferase N-terminal domain-containing protein [Streptomyces litchfieldiae]|uniref:Carbamoyltransferase N-terminal domain-containing protein n=1 Tax=Streptomyces litchfieldiae TaxID=3075543 RepID=A0ABU2MQZ8_9ACTN|nr:carbamoyltransferase N-terminal domain-containing protein [Streptomyces sp. DSM 44938]MDT0343960.1 carbamoyltransferase N-terminal domain-containing protein [Streptomyces sp. DSM 44938]
MLICGIKISHDGGVAVIEDGRLVFSVEVEKLENGRRYSYLGDLDRVTRILASEGIAPSDVDRFVVDGWYTRGADGAPAIATRSGGDPLELPVAWYQDGVGTGGPVERFTFADHDFGAARGGYASYHHVSNHLMGAYCSSPFARRGEDAMVLVWDGGVIPRLYHVEARTRTVGAAALGLPVMGNSFADFSSQFEPFHRDTSGLDADEVIRHHLSIAGKAMAYAALGTVEETAFPVFDDIIAGFSTVSQDNAKEIGEKIAVNRDQLLPGLSNADLIATFQAYLGDLLLRRLTALMGRRLPWQRPSDLLRRGASWKPNLVLGGGCALNIKWNSMLRDSGLFADIWVPPFSNDSGAAIGTACCEMFREDGRTALDWNVYSGPSLVPGGVPAGWHVRPCDERQLAELLHTEGEPVVVLSGRAEIGPRALGNRSILAPATDPAMKDRLNHIKDRAAYRPVAPICLTSRAAEVFAPGGSDPYMLFEHHMRPGWAERVPAIVHLDGTARLQTIDERAGSVTGRILTAYERLSGIPVLCNTSANLNGRGFFPDVASAAAWGGTRYIWSEQRLYTRLDRPASAA